MALANQVKTIRGFTLVEMMIAVAIFAILLSFGLAAFQTMIASTKTKSVAESIFSGLRKARAEAIKRNAPMRFQMVSTLDATCVFSSTSSLWVVTQTNQGGGGYTYGLPSLQCGAATAVPPDPCTAACGNQPFIAFKSSGSPEATIAVQGNDTPGAPATTVTFGPLGQILVNTDTTGTLAQVQVSSTVSGAKTWRVRITPSTGSMKLCDPSGAAVGTSIAC